MPHRRNIATAGTALPGFARVIAFAGFALASAVCVAAVDDRSVCGSVPPKSATVSACSRLIASPATSPHDRALAYSFRANAARANGDTASAVADYSQALTLLPDLLPALIGRGIAYRDSNDPAHATADFDRALALHPKDATALYQRGLAKRKSGDTSGGDADIAAAKAINPGIGDQP
jgi:tetratricopeptide (TPR) repeat protein